MSSFNPFFGSATRKKKSIFDTLPETTDIGLPDISGLSVPTNINQPAPRPQSQGGGLMSVLSNILNSVSTGVGIGFSQDPAQALLGQLAQQRQVEMEKAKMAEDRRRQQIQNESAKELEGIRQRGQEKIVGLEQTGRKELQANEIGAQKEIKNLGFANEKEMQNAQFTNQEKLTKMTQEWEMNKMYDNEDFAKELETLKNTGDIRQAQSKTLMASLFHAMQNSRYVKGAPIPPSAVINITDKVGKGEALTKEETDVIDRAFKASAAANAAAAKGVGSGGGKEGKKDVQLQRQSQLDWEKNRRDLVNAAINNAKVPLLDSGGQQVKDINGNVQMVQAAGPELLSRINDALSVHDAVNPQPFSMQTAHPTPKGGTSEIRDVNALNAQIDQLASQHSIQDINRIIDGTNDLNAAEKRQAKARAANLKKQSSNWTKYIGQ